MLKTLRRICLAMPEIPMFGIFWDILIHDWHFPMKNLSLISKMNMWITISPKDFYIHPSFPDINQKTQDLNLASA